MDTKMGVSFQDQSGWRVIRTRLPALDDIAQITELESACARELASRPAPFAVFDLTGINFVVSRALGMFVTLLKHQKERGATLSLCGLDANVARNMRLTRLDRIFEVYPSVEALLAARPDGRPPVADAPQFGP